MNNTSNVWTEDRVYRPIMILILAVGFIGNALTLVVFLNKKNRTKIIAPFFINLAVADLFIVVLGYPVSLVTFAKGERYLAGTSKCNWNAFINGSIGIASIAMLTEISVIMWYNITSSYVLDNIPVRRKIVLLMSPWLYGGLSMTPPLLGWNRFIPGNAGISCCPDWRSNDMGALTYNIVLVVLGFFLPLTVISISYFKIYRFLARQVTISTNFPQENSRQSQIRVTRVIIASIVAFIVSWSPYCVTCLIAMFSHHLVLKQGEAEIPELMAKSSVIYNPIIYTVLSRQFRESLTEILFKGFRKTEAENHQNP